MFKNRLIAVLGMLVTFSNAWAGVTTTSYSQIKRARPACNLETDWEDSLKEYFAEINNLPKEEQIPALKKEIKKLRKKLHKITKKAELKDPKDN